MVNKHKIFLRDLAAGVLFGLGITVPSRRARGRLVIVTFHRVLPRRFLEEYPFPGLAVTPEEFEWHLSFLRRWFRCMTLQDALRIPGKEWGKGKPIVAVTFDDGRRDNFSYAAPVLKKQGVPATFFVTAEDPGTLPLLWHDRIGYAVKKMAREGKERLDAFLEGHGIHVPSGVPPAYAAVWAAKKMPVGERNAFLLALEEAAGGGVRPAWDGGMDEEQLRALVEEGHEVGSHTMTHPILTQLGGNDLEREVAVSKRVLEGILGRPVSSFSYPNGDYDGRVRRCVEAAGYSSSVTTLWGNNAPSADVLELRRFEMDSRRIMGLRGRLSPSLLSWRMSGLYPGLRFE